MTTKRSLPESPQRTGIRKRARDTAATPQRPPSKKSESSGDGTIMITVRWTPDQKLSLDAMCKAFECDAPTVIRAAVSLAQFRQLGQRATTNDCGVFAVKNGNRELCNSLINPTPIHAALRQTRLLIAPPSNEKATSYRLGAPWKNYWAALLDQYTKDTGGGITDFARDCLDALAALFHLKNDGYAFFVVGGGPEEELFHCLGMDTTPMTGITMHPGSPENAIANESATAPDQSNLAVQQA